MISTGKRAMPGEAAQPEAGGGGCLYFPAVEGLGETYRRVMLNDYFARLLQGSRIDTVAELPLDDYGVVGAGSLVFARHGCRVSLVSGDQPLLEAGRAVFELNHLHDRLALLHADLTSLPVGDDHFDLGWNFDRLLVQPRPEAFLAEMARVCKAVFVCVPNAHNYGQYFHWVYHKLAGRPCAYVEPRAWMRRGPVKRALAAAGMEIVDEGVIDAPWWPGFPELPDLVRSLLGRQPAASPLRQAPVPPASAAEEQQWLDKVRQSAFIERSGWPEPVRQLFAHNVYVLAVKPRYRERVAAPAWP